MDPEYWRQRLFRNTFTYRGRRRRVNSWSVKMQLFGTRKTFSLTCGDPDRAASEACRIYQAIRTQGWDGFTRGGNTPGSGPGQTSVGYLSSGSAASLWKGRLIHRRYPEHAKGELSVRIERDGLGRYFPLGTAEEKPAADRAKQIHQAVVNRGWQVANERFRRELTFALRWLEDPLAWTYTTLHTWVKGDPFPKCGADPNQIKCRVGIIEPEAGIRFALADCANRQEGFACCATYSSAATASRELASSGLDLLLMNYSLANEHGGAPGAELQKLKPDIACLLYSEFEDSEELFRDTPGGASGYMLKRTPCHRVFDLIAGITGPLTPELIAARIREYFQKLVGAMPAPPLPADVARLTRREHEVLALLAKGSLAKEIAGSLGISIWTVHGHVKSIFEKLGVHNRTEAVVKFLQK